MSRIKEIWWEEDDLHIVDEDDKYTIFKGAYLTDMDLSNDSSIVQEHNFEGKIINE